MRELATSHLTPKPPATAVPAGAGHDLTSSAPATERASAWMHHHDQDHSCDTAVSQRVPVLAVPDPPPSTAVLLHGANLLVLTGPGLTVSTALRRVAHRLTALRKAT